MSVSNVIATIPYVPKYIHCVLNARIFYFSFYLTREPVESNRIESSSDVFESDPLNFIFRFSYAIHSVQFQFVSYESRCTHPVFVHDMLLAKYFYFFPKNECFGIENKYYRSFPYAISTFILANEAQYSTITNNETTEKPKIE